MLVTWHVRSALCTLLFGIAMLLYKVENFATGLVSDLARTHSSKPKNSTSILASLWKLYLPELGSFSAGNQNFTGAYSHVIPYEIGVLWLVDLFADIDKLITSHIKKYVKTVDCWMPTESPAAATAWFSQRACWAPISSSLGPSELRSRGVDRPPEF